MTARGCGCLTKALQRPGAPAGLGNERLEGARSRSLTIRCAWLALAPAAEGQDVGGALAREVLPGPRSEIEYYNGDLSERCWSGRRPPSAHQDTTSRLIRMDGCAGEGIEVARVALAGLRFEGRRADAQHDERFQR